MARKMKDSGIEWIGEIPEGWEIRKGKSLYRVATGKLDANAENPDGDYPFFTCSMAPKRINSYSFDCEALLVAGNGLVGFTQYYKGKFDAYQRTYVLSDFRNVLPSFLRYYVSVGLPMEVQPKSIGSVIQFIKLGDLLNFNITLPSIEQQTIISNYLEFKIIQIDAILSKTRSSIEEYKKLKQAVITQAITKGVRGEREMKDSGVEWIGEIPKEWKCQKLKYTIFPQNRPVFSTDEIITCFRDGIVTLRKNRREDGFTVSFTEHGYQGVEIGDLVIHGMDAFAGAIGCSDSRGKTTPVVHVCTTAGNNRFFMFFLRYMAYSNIFMDFSNGIRIRSSDFRNFTKLGIFDVLVPPIAEQNEIADYLNAKCAEIDGLIAKKEQLVKELESYKKSLIYEVVTGKREV